MCNLYSVTTNQEAIRRLSRVDTDRTGNMPPLPGIYPDYAAPVVHSGCPAIQRAATLPTRASGMLPMMIRVKATDW